MSVETQVLALEQAATALHAALSASLQPLRGGVFASLRLADEHASLIKAYRSPDPFNVHTAKGHTSPIFSFCADFPALFELRDGLYYAVAAPTWLPFEHDDDEAFKCAEVKHNASIPDVGWSDVVKAKDNFVSFVLGVIDSSPPPAPEDAGLVALFADQIRSRQRGGIVSTMLDVDHLACALVALQRRAQVASPRYDESASRGLWLLARLEGKRGSLLLPGAALVEEGLGGSIDKASHRRSPSLHTPPRLTALHLCLGVHRPVPSVLRGGEQRRAAEGPYGGAGAAARACSGCGFR